MDFVIEDGILREYAGQNSVVLIPEGVTAIGHFAFRGRNELKSITIPESVTRIGVGAFCYCAGLESIKIPESVTAIGDGVFYNCTGLKSITIPESVKEIGSFAFLGCTGLESITIPESVIIIGDCAFRGCTGLKSIAIPEGVTEIGNGVFLGCRGLKSVTIPESVTRIGAYAFCYCAGLESIELPEYVTTIGDSAFMYCEELKSIKIPESVTAIGDGVFNNCTGLKSINTHISLNKCFVKDGYPEGPLLTNDPWLLPFYMRPGAAIGFAEECADVNTERGRKHLKYIKSNAAKLMNGAMKHPALLRLMAEHMLLNPETAEAYIREAQKRQDTEAIAVLMEYMNNSLFESEKNKAARKVEKREERITEFIFDTAAAEKISGKKIAADGKLITFASHAELRACLESCGASLIGKVSYRTDFLITNDPDSSSVKNKNAHKNGITQITEAEFNEMIGRKV